MKRTRWHAVALGLGLLGMARGDEPAWKPSGSDKPAASVEPNLLRAIPAASKPAATMPTVNAIKSGKDDTVWRPIGIAPRMLPALKSDSIWRSSTEPRVPETATSEARPVIEAPRIDPALRQTAFVGEFVFPASASEPLRLPDPQRKPEPLPPPMTADQAETLKPKLREPVTPPAVLAPMPTRVQVPEVMPKKETAPTPMTVKPQPLPIPQPETKSTPKPETQAPMATTTIIRADESTSVWGGYSNSLQPCVNQSCPTGQAVPPSRHGTFGSANMKLSRDYNLLDECGKPAATQDKWRVLREHPVAAAGDCDQSFVSAEYLLWWANNGDVPVLATTATGAGFGYLGTPGTTLLLGPGSYGSSNPRSGLRLRAGRWCDDDHCTGLDGSFFFLGQQTASTTIASSAFPTIARPFYAPNFGREFAELVAFPGVSTGRFVVEQASTIWGFEANYRRSRGEQREWFAGFRNVNLEETLTMTEYITAGTAAPDPAGTTIVVRDRFDVQNSFFGGQVGGVRGWRWGSVSLDLRGSVALGVTHQVLTIEGSQAKTLPGQPTQFFTGGLLAVGPNLGTFTNNEFSVVPEGTVNLGYQVTSHLKVVVGYNVLGWTNVIRPGEQIDRVVDLTFVPNAPAVPYSGQPRPQPTFGQSDLWIQGVQIGLQGSW